MARGITIDPFTKTVFACVIDAADGSGLEGIYRETDCDCITSVRIDDRNVLYLDDNGLYREGQALFRLGAYPQPLAGRGVILGTSPSGSTVSTTLDVTKVSGLVSWADDIEFSHIVTDEPFTDERGFFMLASHPVFRPKGGVK